MSKQYTLASERADAPTGCAYVHRRSGTSGSAGMEAGHPAATSWAGKSRTKPTPACRFLQMANGTRSLDGHWTAAAPQLTIRR